MRTDWDLPNKHRELSSRESTCIVSTSLWQPKKTKVFRSSTFVLTLAVNHNTIGLDLRGCRDNMSAEKDVFCCLRTYICTWSVSQATMNVEYMSKLGQLIPSLKKIIGTFPSVPRFYAAGFVEWTCR